MKLPSACPYCGKIDCEHRQKEEERFIPVSQVIELLNNLLTVSNLKQMYKNLDQVIKEIKGE